MAGISTKGLYGLAAMYELAQASTDRPMQIKEIAANGDIPHNYLEQLLSSLRKAGLVKSIRGAYGGYFLGRKPEEITVLEILEVLEGSICKMEMKTSSPVLEMFWEDTRSKVQELFSLKLSDLDRYYQQLSFDI
ncbi:Rrf2 family transcriptional regulator [Campylobacterota bacterium]